MLKASKLFIVFLIIAALVASFVAASWANDVPLINSVFDAVCNSVSLPILEPKEPITFWTSWEFKPKSFNFVAKTSGLTPLNVNANFFINSVGSFANKFFASELEIFIWLANFPMFCPASLKNFVTPPAAISAVNPTSSNKVPIAKVLTNEGLNASGNAPILKVKSVIFPEVAAPIAPNWLIAEPVFIIASEIFKSLVSVKRVLIFPTWVTACSIPPLKSLPKAIPNLLDALTKLNKSFWAMPNCPPISAICNNSGIVDLVVIDNFNNESPNFSNGVPERPVVFATSAILSSKSIAAFPATTKGATIAVPTIADLTATSLDFWLIFLKLLSILSARVENSSIPPRIRARGELNLSTAINMAGMVKALIYFVSFIFFVISWMSLYHHIMPK